MPDHVHVFFAGLALASALMPGVALASVEVPAQLNPDKLSIYRVVGAAGVQIYRCSADTAGARAWRLKGPEADLLDEQNRCIGKHYAGPTWEGFDGGKVMGAVKTSMPAPAGNAIPWLLLDVTAREGAGEFTLARAIVRLATTGGAAPAGGCEEAQSGQELRVPYAAAYVFLK